MKYESNPYLLLSKMAETVQDALARQSTHKEFTDVWSGVGFLLCGRSMAASMGEVTEIITLPKCTYVPGVKDWVMGVANVRGTLLPIIDLECFFGGTLVGNRRSHRVLIVEYGGVSIGLVVSKVMGLQHIGNDAFDFEGDWENEAFSEFVDSQYQYASQDWFRFVPAKLFESQDFIDASRSFEGLGANSNNGLAA